MAKRKQPPLNAFQRQLRGIRRRLLWVVVAFGLGAGSTWYFRHTVIMWLLAPARGHLSATGQPIFIGPTEVFGLAINLAIKGGIVVAFPMLVFQVASFLRPILSKKQRRFITIFLPAGFVFYLAGTAFAYFVMLPTGLAFLLAFGTDVATPMIQITQYMDLVLALIFWLGVVFELPLVMFLLAKLRLVSYKRFKRFRRYVPVAAFFLGAIITPTFDIINQTLVSVPIILLFEVGMLLAWLARPRVPVRRM